MYKLSTVMILFGFSINDIAILRIVDVIKLKKCKAECDSVSNTLSIYGQI